jgi:MoaA/NifB/PqqE/SkfB family radical SAM enzyme
MCILANTYQNGNLILMEKKSNKTLCLAPWLSLHTWPDGSTFPCCVWDADDPIGNINDSSLPEIWNGDKLRDVRKKMLKGEEVKSCERCYKLEKTEPNSYRIKINKDFEHRFNIIEKTDSNGNVEDMEIRLWDFRLSNFCNLSCRSCGLDLSSSWYSDTIELQPTLKGKVKALITVNDKVSFMDMIEDQYEYVEEIYFAGGEPLITPEHFTILERLIEIGNTDIRLRYSTNYTKVKYKGKHIFEYWKHFSNVQVLVSLDGVKEQGEYIRKGLNYNTLKQNIHELRDSNLTFSAVAFMVTFGVLNYEHLFDMVIEFIEQDMIDKTKVEHTKYGTHSNGTPRPREVMFSPIYRPDNLDCSYLPSTFKKRFAIRLAGFENELKSIGVDKYVSSDIMHKLRAVYDHSIQNQYNKDIMKSFVRQTTKLDQVRKEKFEDIFPNINLLTDYLQDSLV